VRLIPRPNPLKTFSGWSCTFGVAAVLALTGIARSELRSGHAPPRDAAPAPAVPAPEAPLRVTVSADGSVSVADEGRPVGLEDLPAHLAKAGGRPVELSVDPRAPAATVDAFLNRLRDAGASRCTLLVDRAALSEESTKAPEQTSPRSK
jgi:biopolymer transport protein ExbD